MYYVRLSILLLLLLLLSLLLLLLFFSPKSKPVDQELTPTAV